MRENERATGITIGEGIMSVRFAIQYFFQRIQRVSLLACCMLGFGATVSAQLITNDGAAVTINSGSTAVIYVDGGLLNQNGGTWDNSGEIKLTGDWTHNASNYLFINSSPGTVTMTGTNQQILGSGVTHFHHLDLDGPGTKHMVNTDIQVEGILSLDSAELATDTNTAFITNTAIAALTRATGFVSSLGDGGLSRQTNFANTYQFFVGSSAGTSRYRPVDIQPTNSSPQTFKVRMANVDPTAEGYSTTNKDTSLCLVSDEFFHLISRANGSASADIVIWFDSLYDGGFNAMAHWQNLPQWQNMGTISTNFATSPTLSNITVSGWNDFILPPFALANINPAISLSSTSDTICIGDTVHYTATPGLTNYQFLNGNSQVQSGPSNMLSISTLTNGDTISVVATDAFGCSGTDLSTIVVTTPPTSAFYCDSSNAPTVDFTDQSTGNATSWSWDFGDGITSILQNPSHTYNSSGTYSVTLIVENLCGNDTITKQVAITIVGISDQLDHAISIYPNPNDGRFQVQISHITTEKALFEVYDARGRKVYAAKSGRFSGSHIEAIDLSMHSNGAYLIKVMIGDVVVMKRVVLR